MKKSLIALSTLFFLAIGVTNAQTENTDTKITQDTQTEKMQQAEKTKIQADELPEMIQTALESDKYDGWEVEESFEVKTGNETMYEIVLTDGERKTTYKFDKEGKTLS